MKTNTKIQIHSTVHLTPAIPDEKPSLGTTDLHSGPELSWVSWLHASLSFSFTSLTLCGTEFHIPTIHRLKKSSFTQMLIWTSRSPSGGGSCWPWRTVTAETGNGCAKQIVTWQLYRGTVLSEMDGVFVGRRWRLFVQSSSKFCLLFPTAFYGLFGWSCETNPQDLGTFHLLRYISHNIGGDKDTKIL